MSKAVFDERAVQRLEGMYRKRDVLRRRRAVREALAARTGDRVLDVGCGPGFYSAELLAEVRVVPVVDRVDEFVRLLDGVARERVRRA